MHLLRKRKHSVEGDDLAVVKSCGAADISENLMRYHTHKLKVKRLVAVDKRLEGAVKTAVVRNEFPVFHITRLAVLLVVAGYDKLRSANLAADVFPKP